MAKFAKFKLEEPKAWDEFDGSEIMTFEESYEDDAPRRGSAKQSWLEAEPHKFHIEIPEGVSEDAPKLVWVDDHYEVEEDADLKAIVVQAQRNAKLGEIRAMRDPKLAEADIEIFKLEDLAADASSWRAYRVALRDFTETWKKVDGNAKAIIDSVDLEALSWPAKPE